VDTTLNIAGRNRRLAGIWSQTECPRIYAGRKQPHNRRFRSLTQTQQVPRRDQTREVSHGRHGVCTARLWKSAWTDPQPPPARYASKARRCDFCSSSPVNSYFLRGSGRGDDQFRRTGQHGSLNHSHRPEALASCRWVQSLSSRHSLINYRTARLFKVSVPQTGFGNDYSRWAQSSDYTSLGSVH